MLWKPSRIDLSVRCRSTFSLIRYKASKRASSTGWNTQAGKHFIYKTMMIYCDGIKETNANAPNDSINCNDNDNKLTRWNNAGAINDNCFLWFKNSVTTNEEPHRPYPALRIKPKCPLSRFHHPSPPPFSPSHIPSQPHSPTTTSSCNLSKA